jgi:hypothetical protein
MTDITKCSGTGCSVKDNCYRYKAKSGMFQSMFATPPGKDDSCNYYWKVEDSLELKRLNRLNQDWP